MVARVVACAIWIRVNYGHSLYSGCRYEEMVKNQPVVMTGWSVVDFWISVAGVVLVIIGQVLVITSTWQLGIIGTYLGDYFGILMDAPVTAFPFSVLKHPMYVGSTVIYLGYGLVHLSPAGILGAVWVSIVYQISTALFEEPFTNKIYGITEDRGKAKKA